MRFQVPQFIETETKIVGPLTLKQFLWVAAGAAIIFFLFMMTQGSFVFYLIAVPTALLFGALAFIKVNDLPLIEYAAYMLTYILNPKSYVFKKEDEEQPWQTNQPNN